MPRILFPRNIKESVVIYHIMIRVATENREGYDVAEWKTVASGTLFAVRNNTNYFLRMKYRIKITKKNIWIRRNARTLYKNNRIVSEINSILFET